MAFRRGFKSEAHSLANEVRAELDLHPLSRLDPFKLVAHLEIPAFPLSHLSSTLPDAVHQLTVVDESALSGVTVFHDIRRVIVFNDAHHPGRQASDIAHEAAHALLHHPPAPAFDELGCRNWNDDQEDEAKFLSAALLVTEAAACDIVRRGMSEWAAAERYGVTRKLIRYRVNVTGARRRVARVARYRQTARSR